MPTLKTKLLEEKQNFLTCGNFVVEKQVLNGITLNFKDTDLLIKVLYL